MEVQCQHHSGACWSFLRNCECSPAQWNRRLATHSASSLTQKTTARRCENLQLPDRHAIYVCDWLSRFLHTKSTIWCVKWLMDEMVVIRVNRALYSHTNTQQTSNRWDCTIGFTESIHFKYQIKDTCSTHLSTSKSSHILRTINMNIFILTSGYFSGMMNLTRTESERETAKKKELQCRIKRAAS